MDPNASRLPRPSAIPRPSSIPRLSKLPVPASAKTAQQSRLSPAPSPQRLRSKPSTSSLSAAASPRASSTTTTPVKNDHDIFKKPIARPASRQARERVRRPAIAAISTSMEQDEDQLGDLEGFRASSRLSHRDAHSGEFDFGFGDETESIEQVDPKPRKPRSSLSDRTIESLSQIMQPTSPTSRQSSWFGPTSPMGPPSRPASAMSRASRSDSRNGFFRSGSQMRPLTPTLGPPSSSSRASSSTRASYGANSFSTTPGNRSASAASRSPAAASVSSHPEEDLVESSPSGRLSKTPMGGSKTWAGRIPKTRPVLGNTFGDSPLSPPKVARSSNERALAAMPTTAASKKAPTAKKTAPISGDEGPDSAQKAASSSAALREQIAKAKAARKAAMTKPPMPITNEAPVQEPELEAYEDPFNQLPKGGDAVIRNRVNAARSDGRLNIANMGLTEIPTQVMSMYEFDPDNAGAAWSEAVDLVRFNAADNDFERLPDELFPDIDPIAIPEDEDANGPQFGGIEMLDFHGNMLKELPIGLRRLERLTVLNLSRNRLNNSSFEVISQINGLRELRLAENELEGDFPEAIGSLTNLEILELQRNKISRLPDSMQELINLRVLNVATNRLSSLPIELFQNLPLVELVASKNALRGTFFPVTVTEMQRLQTLDVSGNALGSLSSTALSMPALQSLNVSINRLETLPDLSEWSNLLTLLAEENKLSKLPSGFTTLKFLKYANLNGNDISKIDSEVGLMESLERLTLAANPLRERKFLTMNTEDMKKDLKMRITPATHDDRAPENTDDLDDSANGVLPATSMWSLRSAGILDLSSNELGELDDEKFSEVAGDCRQLILHHNHFVSIPESISLARTITLLDLSNNRLATTFTDAITLPNLRELRLSANKLPSFDFLIDNLSAPHLQHLDVSSNRIAGTLPPLRASFPELTHLLVSDNSLEEISAEALDGLVAANFSNNSIGRVPPEIGLLWERGLKSLELEGNVFRVPNYAVLRRGTEAVLAWLRDKIPSQVPVRWEDETF